MILKYADYFNVNTDYIFGRCNCKVKYSQLNEMLTNKMRLSDMINIVSDLSKEQRRYLYETILLLSRSK